jgi:hypothetical protein
MNQQFAAGCFLFIFSCNFRNCNKVSSESSFESVTQTRYKTVIEIPTPQGFARLPAEENTFTQWLRSISLKEDNKVYLYDGTLKNKQSVQFAVLDIPVGKRNLQQCADAVIRLRAEYLFAQKRFNEISFADNTGKEYKWQEGENRSAFEKYLEMVFGWCGSASLEKQLKPVLNISEIQPGYVFIRGGFPGHAMIVADVAINNKGEKLFMLAQSYMPAQDIHIVKNPLNEELSPWYEVKNADVIITPEWKFYSKELRRWE